MLNRKNLMNTLSTILAVLGLLISLYTVFLYTQLKLHPDTPMSCDLSDRLSCSHSLKGPHSALLGMANGFPGLFYFAVFLFLPLIQKWFQLSLYQILNYQLIWAMGGALSSIGFIILMAWIEKIYCPICLSVHSLNAFLILMSIWRWVQARTTRDRSHPNWPHWPLILLSLTILATPIFLGGWILEAILNRTPPSEASKEWSPEDFFEQISSDQKQLLEVHNNPLEPSTHDLITGSSNPSVTILVYSDLGCAACHSLMQELLPLINEFQNEPIRWVYRHLPYDQTCNPLIQTRFHDGACALSRWTLCANQQISFWKILPLLEQEIGYIHLQLDDDNLSKIQNKIITQFQLNGANLQTCLEKDATIDNKLKHDIETGNALDFRRVPLLFINQKLFKGSFSQTRLKSAIQYELEKERASDRRHTDKGE